MWKLTTDIYDLEQHLAGLEFQRQRIFNATGQKGFGGLYVSPVHDVDFYTMILRRIYRKLRSLSEQNRKIFNIFSQKETFLENIRVRDHFDKEQDVEKIQPYSGGPIPGLGLGGVAGAISSVKILSTLVDKEIISGQYRWHLDLDHRKLKEIVFDIIAILREETPPT